MTKSRKLWDGLWKNLTEVGQGVLEVSTKLSNHFSIYSFEKTQLWENKGKVIEQNL